MPKVKRQKRAVKVLLLQDNENLGHVGEVVSVKPGFARNYLLPERLACKVTADAMQRVERDKKKAVEVRAERTAALAALADRIEGLSLMMEEKASDEGHLFGSVGAPEIVAALAEKQIEVEERQIDIERPFKELGIYTVPVKLSADKSSDVRVWIVEPS
ncbi:MAG: 50S ribosomal protein L9 [Planctomycetota bacterium]